MLVLAHCLTLVSCAEGAENCSDYIPMPPPGDSSALLAVTGWSLVVLLAVRVAGALAVALVLILKAGRTRRGGW